MGTKSGNTDLGYPRLHAPKRKQFHDILQFYRTEEVISQGRFIIHWWVYQRGNHSKTGKLFHKPKVFSDNVLSLGW